MREAKTQLMKVGLGVNKEGKLKSNCPRFSRNPICNSCKMKAKEKGLRLGYKTRSLAEGDRRRNKKTSRLNQLI